MTRSLLLPRSMDDMTRLAEGLAGFLVAERRHVIAWGGRNVSNTSVSPSPRFSRHTHNGREKHVDGKRRHAEAATIAVYFGLGMPPLDGGISCSTDFVHDPSTWGLFDIRGTHVKTPQAITCRRSATTDPSERPVSRITSYLHRSTTKNHPLRLIHDS